MAAQPFEITQDGSLLDAAGKVIYFSCERFVHDICEGGCCFICGTSRSQATFNDEHVLPAWLLRRFDLQARTIALPNGGAFKYGRYVISCCATCNSLMGRSVEAPVSNLLTEGYAAVCGHVAKHGSALLSVWLGLIFLKTHLRDRHFRLTLDRRQAVGAISEIYAWEDLHHLHRVVRSFYTETPISPGTVGSLLVMPYQIAGSREAFDYADMYTSQCVFMRLGNTALYAVLNDACLAINRLMPRFKRISGPLNELQAREVFAELAFVNHQLAERPLFRSQFRSESGDYEMTVKCPEPVHFRKLDLSIRGEFLHYAIRDILPRNIRIGGLEGDDAAEFLKKGQTTFLFDDDGAFIDNGRIT